MTTAEPLHTALARAQTLIAVRRYDEAILVLAHVLAGEPRNCRAQCLLAQCHLGLGDPTAALASANAAASSDPTDEWAHRLRSIASLRLKDKRTALAAAREAVRVAPLQMLGYVTLVDAELAYRHLEAAADAAARARELEPRSPVGHNAMGLVALRRRRAAEAETHFRDALRCDPEHAGAMNNLGVALQQQGRKRQAIHYFAEASRLDPHHSRARRNAVAATGTGVSVVAIVVAVQAIGALENGLVEFAVVAVLAGLLLPYVIRRLRAGRASAATHRDPVASKELIRQLKSEAGTRGVRPEWLLRTTGVFAGFILGLPLFVTGLDEATSSNQRSLADLVYIAAGAGLMALAVWLLRLNRAANR